MTQPLTPLEKVELKPCPFCGGEVFADQEKSSFIIGCFRTKCGMEPYCTGDDLNEIANQWNRRASLASGSGDHAELAALCRYVQGARDNYERAIRTEEWSRKFTPELASAILAEITALRADADRSEKHRNDMADKITSLSIEIGALRSANTEAERKLAEAVGLLRWARHELPEINPSNYDHDDACHLNAKSVEVTLAIISWLSKEAERG